MFKAGIDKVRCAGISYGVEERDAVIKIISSLPDPWISMGKKTNEFEQLVAEYIGVKYGIATNSGSSANLIMLLALKNFGYLKDGDEIITNSLTWATTVFPIIQLGLIPVFVDADSCYNMYLENIESGISNKTKCILVTHLFGYPNDMDKIQEIATKHNLIILEDNCEALGTEYNERRTGSFGFACSQSFFIAHHITTGEGGMILTNDFDMARMCRSLRAFGRACTCPVCKVAEDPNYYCPLRHKSDYDRRYTFDYLGYSMKPIEISSAIGVEQIKKADVFLKRRKENAKYLTTRLKKYSEYLQLPFLQQHCKSSWFVYPIVVKKNIHFTRDEIVKYLEEHNIETRPLMAGNIIDQPAMKNQKYRVIGTLDGTNCYTRNGFFIGVFQGITDEMRKYQVKIISEFIEGAIHG